MGNPAPLIGIDPVTGKPYNIGYPSMIGNDDGNSQRRTLCVHNFIYKADEWMSNYEYRTNDEIFYGIEHGRLNIYDPSGFLGGIYSKEYYHTFMRDMTSNVGGVSNQIVAAWYSRGEWKNPLPYLMKIGDFDTFDSIAPND